MADLIDFSRRFVDGHPEICVFSNVIVNGEAIGSLGAGEAVWHTDMSYLPAPPKASMLDALEIPLSDSGFVRPGVTPTDDPREAPGTPHPAICTHPASGRRGLYLERRRNAWLVGLDLSESDALLDEIWAHVTQPAFCWTHEWRVGDLVLWDNRCTMQRTPIKGERPDRQPTGSARTNVITTSREQAMPDLRITAGIPGATSIATARRLFDARYATRWFVGSGLDIGPGPDSLALYAELFPRITALRLFDVEDGDAQTLDGLADESFDFAYASHCLEHVRDPAIALRNWARVVRPGGHLILAVPDEDLYEQGTWPSRFNTDHKTTWTLSKRESWSPVSVNVLSLLTELNDIVRPLKLELADHGYRRAIAGQGFDQTRTPLTDAAIEMVLQRL